MYTTMHGDTVPTDALDFDQPQARSQSFELTPTTAPSGREGHQVAVYRRDPITGTHHYLGTGLLRVSMHDYCVITLATDTRISGAYRWSATLNAWTFGRGTHAIILKVLP